MDSSLLPPDLNPAFEVPGRYGPPRQARLVAALMALGVTVFMVLVLLYMAVLHDQGHKDKSILTALQLTPKTEEKVPPAHPASRDPDTPQRTAPAATTKLPPRIDVKNPEKVEWPEGFIHTDHTAMANSDISKIHSGVAPGNAQASGGGGRGEGDGPDSRGYYRGDWYRKPRMAELEPYWPVEKRKTGWGDIVCRTAPHYHVEDCRQLGDSEPNLGLSRALREASWQWLVRPPKHGSEDMIGVWVTIRWYQTMRKAGEDEDGPKTGESP